SEDRHHNHPPSQLFRASAVGASCTHQFPARRAEIGRQEFMNIGVIGAGNLGTALAGRLIKMGHRVFLSFSKDPGKLKAAAESLAARSGSPAEAVEFGEIVILATPWIVTAEALRQVGQMVANRILWDCTNPLKPDRSSLVIGITNSGGEEVARLAPWARV